ncbi:3D domain-containing protein [Patescibacteria group bacterium]
MVIPLRCLLVRRQKILIASMIIAGIAVGISLFFIFKAQGVGADLVNPPEVSGLTIIEENSLKSVSAPPAKNVVRRIRVIATAYSSTVWQTDDTPFITAAGTSVRNGVVANNLLPFGTKIRMPEIYGDDVFVVEDRMHSRQSLYHVDIWFSSYQEAKNFGAKTTYIEILES